MLVMLYTFVYCADCIELIDIELLLNDHLVILGVLNKSDVLGSFVQTTYWSTGLRIPSASVNTKLWHEQRPHERMQCAKAVSRVYQNLCLNLARNGKVLVSFTTMSFTSKMMKPLFVIRVCVLINLCIMHFMGQ